MAARLLLILALTTMTSLVVSGTKSEVRVKAMKFDEMIRKDQKTDPAYFKPYDCATEQDPSKNKTEYCLKKKNSNETRCCLIGQAITIRETYFGSKVNFTIQFFEPGPVLKKSKSSSKTDQSESEKEEEKGSEMDENNVLKNKSLGKYETEGREKRSAGGKVYNKILGSQVEFCKCLYKPSEERVKKFREEMRDLVKELMTGQEIGGD